MEFWKEESSLYQIIKDHLDQEGYFDPDLIEDQNFVDTYAVLFREPDCLDGYNELVLAAKHNKKE